MNLQNLPEAALYNICQLLDVCSISCLASASRELKSSCQPLATQRLHTVISHVRQVWALVGNGLTAHKTDPIEVHRAFWTRAGLVGANDDWVAHPTNGGAVLGGMVHLTEDMTSSIYGVAIDGLRVQIVVFSTGGVGLVICNRCWFTGNHGAQWTFQRIPKLTRSSVQALLDVMTEPTQDDYDTAKSGQGTQWLRARAKVDAFNWHKASLVACLEASYDESRHLTFLAQVIHACNRM